MLTLVSILIACQPCQKTSTGDELSRGAAVIAVLANGKLATPPKDAPPRVGSSGSFTADVVLVLKGKIARPRIEVRWDYGMCGYPAPNVGKAATVVFLYANGEWFEPGSAGCGPVQLAYDATAKTIEVDGEALSVAEFKRRYAAAK